MWTRHYKKRRTGAFVVPVITVAFLSYFGFHAYHGTYGIYSKYALEDRLVALDGQLERLSEERRILENRVRLLQDGSIERDMLDEQARRLLSIGNADEVVILLDRPMY